MNIKFQTPLNSEENKQLKNKLTSFISSKIRKDRQEKQMTQEELAEKSGLHLTYIAHLEAGKYHPSVFVLWKIAKVLEVSLNTFVSDSPY